MTTVQAWLPGVLAVGTFLVLHALERRWPLRRSVEPGAARVFRNLALGALGAAVLQVLDRPVTSVLARHVDAGQLGLLPALGVTGAVEIACGLLLLDYTIFLWHGLLHRVPALWRFHEAHHTDLDVDASTALRFHAGELAASVAWRSAQIVVLGIRPQTLALWHSVLFLNVLFHHSNLRLPARFEVGLGRLMMTPRLHGIHHSIVPDEMRSNLSSGLALWDYLHRTRRADVPQEAIVIGVAEHRAPEKLRLKDVLALPFAR
jgi:sterol desaturase/sphingolipid hydroxylase (fatty acid hydroxylase superfamily)